MFWPKLSHIVNFFWQTEKVCAHHYVLQGFRTMFWHQTLPHCNFSLNKWFQDCDHPHVFANLRTIFFTLLITMFFSSFRTIFLDVFSSCVIMDASMFWSHCCVSNWFAIVFQYSTLSLMLGSYFPILYCLSSFLSERSNDCFCLFLHWIIAFQSWKFISVLTNGLSILFWTHFIIWKPNG